MSPFAIRQSSISNSPGFSLIELLVVIGIVAVLAGLAIPAFNSIGQARGVTEAGFQVAAAVEQARAEAIARRTFVWLGLRQETNAGNLDLRLGAVYSKDGSSSLANANLEPLQRPVVIQRVALDLAGDTLGAGNFTIGSTAFTNTLTFTPSGELLKTPSPAPTDGFERQVNLLLKSARGTTILEDNPVRIILDGSTALPSILRQ